MAQTIWADAYIDGLRGDNLKNDVLSNLNDYKDKYDFEITDHGVTVTPKENKQLNEYGFYYDVPYEDTYENEDGIVEYYYMVFKPNNIVEYYYHCPEGAYYAFDGYDGVEYEKNKILFDFGAEITVSNNGTLLSQIYEENTYTYEYSDKPYRGIYYDTKYYFTDHSGYMMFNETEGSIEMYNIQGELEETIEKTAINEVTSHGYSYGDNYIGISMDGKELDTNDNHAYIIDPNEEGIISFTLKHICNFNDDEITEIKCYAESGMTWEQWINSKYNVIGAKKAYGTISIVLYNLSGVGCGGDPHYFDSELDCYKNCEYDQNISLDTTYLLKHIET